MAKVVFDASTLIDRFGADFEGISPDMAFTT